MAALVKKYGTERIIINSAADWGVSDPLKVRKTADTMREVGISETEIETVVWSNPLTFFGQSGRLELGLARDGERPSVDQRKLWEGSSVLRGQVPLVVVG